MALSANRTFNYNTRNSNTIDNTRNSPAIDNARNSAAIDNADSHALTTMAAGYPHSQDAARYARYGVRPLQDADDVGRHSGDHGHRSAEAGSARPL
jgi:hypothetical protein